LPDPALPPQQRIEALAERYLQAIRTAQPAGPYALVGHSFGGFLAFDIARRLDALGERVELLGIIDTAVHQRWLSPRDRASFLIMRPIRYARTLLRSPRTELPRYLRKVAARAGLGEPDPGVPPLIRERIATGWEGWAAYRPQPYAGAVTLFRAEYRDGGISDALTIWREVARGGLAIEQVHGGHNEMLVDPNVGMLAERLSARLTDGAVAQREDQVAALRGAELPRQPATMA
jgi:acetoacetyl-CoA synthetase